MIAAGQLKAARALIGWTQEDVAAKAGLSVQTVKRMETMGLARSSAGNVMAVQSSLQSAGVIFIDENGEGPGVRLRKDRKG